MKKMIATFAFVTTMALGSSVFASGQDVADCAKMKHVSMFAKEMKDVSACATATDCPMSGCQQ